jgi:methionyl-tRNA formyltransferase
MMRVAVIGRTETLFASAEKLLEAGHEIGLIVSAKEAPEYLKTLEDFRALAGSAGAVFIHSSKISDAYEQIAELPTMDIAISMNYVSVISQSVIDLFRLGILNAHGGDLPRYRGNACQAWAILNKEEQVGLCIHKMIGAELDSGDIISREYFPLTIDTKITQVYEWINIKVPELFASAVKELGLNDTYFLERQSTNPADVLRCYPRRPEDGRIDWHKDSADILRLINASNKPYSGAYCTYEGAKFTILDAEQVDDTEVFLATPGQVIKIGDGYIDVACGIAKKLRIRNVGYEGNECKPDTIVHSIRARLENCV